MVVPLLTMRQCLTTRRVREPRRLLRPQVDSDFMLCGSSASSLLQLCTISNTYQMKPKNLWQHAAGATSKD